ncbi:DUF6414 family protein [Neisseria bergeri]|jgi:hypothetical protein|uniref:DUF6414 family protein n=1 Tax=Neisseria bergeri TaxID=1906581 RepID=UPI0027DFD038|nr:hypothetical protein [Neisseria bergeri]
MERQEAEENCLYDFIYINHDVLAFYNAQLDKDGLLTQSVVTHSSEDQNKQNLKGGLAVFGGGVENSSNIKSSRQNSFDTSKNMPLSVIRELNARGLIRDNIEQTKPGQVVLFSGRMQIVDLALMNSMVKPSMEMQLAAMHNSTEAHRRKRREKEAEIKSTAAMMESLPKLLQIRVFDDEKSVWCAVRHDDMLPNTSALALKHDVTIPGEWHVVAVLDALPNDNNDLDNKAFEYMTDMDTAYFTAFLHLRTVMGRRFNEYGITPLVIFRKIA